MISIIIPVYNEEKTVRETLSTLPHNDKIEVIVVDGGSCDRTAEFAKQFPVKVVQTIKNRALQMNEGAKVAVGDIFLFLHADCILERESLEIIRNALNNGYAGGCLSQKINSPKLIYRIIEASGNIRARLFKIFYGDQAVFVRREAFFKIGGFDEVDLFDDVIFSQKLKRLGRTCVLKNKVYSSARRWERQRIIRATFINWLLTLGFIFGISSEKLKELYPDVR